MGRAEVVESALVRGGAETGVAPGPAALCVLDRAAVTFLSSTDETGALRAPGVTLPGLAHWALFVPAEEVADVVACLDLARIEGPGSEEAWKLLPVMVRNPGSPMAFLELTGLPCSPVACTSLDFVEMRGLLRDPWPVREVDRLVGAAARMRLDRHTRARDWTVWWAGRWLGPVVAAVPRDVLRGGRRVSAREQREETQRRLNLVRCEQVRAVLTQPRLGDLLQAGLEAAWSGRDMALLFHAGLDAQQARGVMSDGAVPAAVEARALAVEPFIAS